MSVKYPRIFNLDKTNQSVLILLEQHLVGSDRSDITTNVTRHRDVNRYFRYLVLAYFIHSHLHSFWHPQYTDVESDDVASVA